MKNFISVFILAFLSATTVFSQNKKEVLMTIDGSPVYANEFKRVYKKNLNLVQDESQKDIDGYLNLFIDYKLKIAAAQAQGLADKRSYQNELSRYRDQLSRNYLFDNKVTETLAREAYERGKVEIDASHILILVDYEAVPQDTLIAYNKIKSIREKALKGEDFTQLAKTNSEEPGAKETGGNLGYFSVFSMVYPFENAAYNTKVDDISEIVRSRFGYHIVKVNDRRAKMPKISVSHIMISDKKGARDFDPEQRIDELFTMAKQGESFESLAQQFSDDKNSAIQGGKLKPFSKGDLRATEFENAAYGLNKVGEMSKPVKTDFGWHIIRLDEKLPMESFEDQREELEKKAGEGDRSKVVTNAINKKIKDKYGFKKEVSYLPYFDTFVTDDVLGRGWARNPVPAEDDKVLFTIGDKDATFTEFATFIAGRQKTTKPFKQKEALLVAFYDEFETEILKDYFKMELEDENEDYAAIVTEYRDGLLIFDVMNENIWEKAKIDSIGLKDFYNKTKQKYQWKERVNVDIYSATSEMTAQQIQKMLADGKTTEEIKADLNTENKVNVFITPGLFEVDDDKLPKNLEMKNGASRIYEISDSFVVVNIKEMLPSGLKSLEDVKGRVLSDYQNELEKNWIEGLRSKYTVEVNKKALKRVKKELR